MARVRILEDDVLVVRYSELEERVALGQGAKQIAVSLGLSPAAITFHFAKMGLRYDRRSEKWVKV